MRKNKLKKKPKEKLKDKNKYFEKKRSSKNY
jgi:hypothetical protein